MRRAPESEPEIPLDGDDIVLIDLDDLHSLVEIAQVRVFGRNREAHEFAQVARKTFGADDDKPRAPVVVGAGVAPVEPVEKEEGKAETVVAVDVAYKDSVHLAGLIPCCIRDCRISGGVSTSTWPSIAIALYGNPSL